MANQKRTIDYEIQFRTNQLSLQNVNKVFRLFFDNFKYSDLLLINNSTKEKATKDLLEILKTANTVEAALTAAFNPKLGITNIDTFKNNLKAAGTSIEQVRASFDKAGGAGTLAFQAMANSLTNVRLKATESESIIDKMGETLKRTLTWSISSSVINKMAGSIQEAYGYVKHLDTSLNDIRIVTEYSAEAMDKFAEKANKAAITLGKSTTDYTEAALIYYQQGLGEEDVAARTDVTLKTANVTQQSTAQVSEELTAIWNGYKVNAEEAEAYIDKVAKVAAVTAADLEEMATGMSKVASAANVMGVDIDQMNAILATTISVTRQAPESVGAAYKTIFARMSLIQAGEETEDGATLKSYTEQMAAMGVSVLDANNKLRDMGDIIEEVGNKWSSWGREQQIAFALVAAGTRQYNNLIALFDNWGMYEKTLEESKNALGTLLTQQDIYMESTAAHLQQLRTAAEGVYDSLLNAKDINSVVDVFTNWAKGIETVVDGLGGLKGILAAIAPLMINAFSKNIGNFFGQTLSNFNIKAENQLTLNSLTLSITALGDAADPTTLKYLKLKELLAKSASHMDADTFNRLAQGIYDAFNAETQLEKATLDALRAEEAHTKAIEEKRKAEEKLKQTTESLINTENLEKDSNISLIEQKLKENLGQALGKLNSEKAKLSLMLEPIDRNTEIHNRLLQIDNTDFSSYSEDLFNALMGEQEALKKEEAELAQEVAKANKELQQLKDVVKNALADVDKYTNELLELSTAEKEATLAETIEAGLNADLGEARERLSEATQRNAAEQGVAAELSREQFNQLGQGITLMAVAVASINAIKTSLKNLASVMTDETIPAGEKVVQILTNLGTVGILGFSAVTNGIQGFLMVLSVWNNTIPLTISSSNALVSSFTGITASAGTATIAVGTLIATVLAAVAAIAAITWATIEITKAVQDYGETTSEATEALEKANKALEKLKSNANEAATALSSLTSSIEDLKLKQQELSETTKGTEEWNTKLQEVNDTVLLLIENYPELIKYLLIANGQYSISEKGLEEYKKILEYNSKVADQGLLLALSDKRQADYDLAISTFADSKQGRKLYQTGKGEDRLIYARNDINNTSIEEIQKRLNELSTALNDKKQELLEIEEKIATAEGNVVEYTTDDLQTIQYETEALEEEITGYTEILKIKLQYKDIDLERLKIALAIVSELNKETINKFREDTDKTYSVQEQDIIINAATAKQGQIYNNLLANLDAKDTATYDTILHDFFEKNWLTSVDASMITDEQGNRGYMDSLGNFITEDSIRAAWAAEEAGIHASIEEIIKNIYSGANGFAKAITDTYQLGMVSILLLSNLNIAILEEAARQGDAVAQEIVDNYKQEENKIKNSLAAKSERLGYATAAANITDWDTLTFELKKLIADKIHEAFKEGGSEGVQNLVLQMKDTDFEAAVQLTVKTPEEDLALALKDAGVKQEDYDAEVAYRSALGESYDSQDLINYLAALKELNNIYKDRSNIFSSLANFKWETANGQLKEYLISLKLTFSTLTGKDINFDFILKNLDLIEDYIEGVDGAADLLDRRLKALSLSEVAETKESIDAKFKEYTPKDNQQINDDLKSFINEEAKKLGYTDEQLKELYKAYGYEWDEDTHTYIYHMSYSIVRNKSVSELFSDDYLIYVEEKKKLGEEFLDFLDWLEENGWYQVGEYEWHLIQDLTTEVSAKTYWNKKESYHLTEDEVKKVLEVIPEETLIDLGGHKIDENNWVLECDYTTLVKLRTIFEESGSEIPDFLGSKENKTSTKAIKKTTVTPKLDTSAEDRQLKQLELDKKKIQDLEKDLTGDALRNALQQELDLETQIYDVKVKKLEKEKAYLQELTSNLNEDLNEAQLLAFTTNSEGFITNINEVEKAYVNKINELKAKGDKISDDETQQLSDLEQDLSKINSYVSAYNSSRSKSVELDQETYEYNKKIAEINQKITLSHADRTAATSSELANLQYQAENTTRALEALGDAGDLSGTALIKYNDTRISLLELQEKEAEEKLRILAEERLRLLGDAENANSLMGQANKLGVDVQFREDGSVDLDAMKADWQEIQDSLKYSNEELAEMGRIWQVIEKYGKNYNSNVDDSNKAIEDHLKYSKEIARLEASKQYAEINAELEDAAKKAGILKQNLEHAKAVFDKAGDNKKNFVKGYIESLEEYDKVQEAVLKRSAERFEKLKQDWNPQSDTTALSAAFNAEDMESFMAVYGEALLELIELDKELENEISKTLTRITDLTKAGYKKNKDEIELLNAELEILKERQKQVGLSADDLTDKYEHLSSKMADMSQVADLSKEWKTAAVDREIKKVNRELSLLQKLQSRLKGKDVIANLQLQVAVIQKLINLEKNKLKILQAQALTQRVLIQEMITQMQLQGLGSAFDSSGHVNAIFLDKLAKKADLANEEVQILISALKDYESIMNEIESQQDAIVSLQDEIADKQYEISEKIYEETRKEAEKLLNKFKIEIEVDLNEAEMMRKIDRLKAKVAAMPSWDLAGAMGLDQADAISYATKDVTILTGAVNKLITDYQSDAWKDFYDTLKDAYDDIISYANLLTSAVESFYDALDTARLKYSEAIDNVINSNQQLIDDLEYIKKLSKHGINITKMMFGENSYLDMAAYYKKISDTTKEQIKTANELAAYYAALLATIDPMTHPEEYKAVADAQKATTDSVYAYTTELANLALEEMNARMESAANTFKDVMAKAAGYANAAMKDIGQDRQQRILKDYLDTYESQYEMITLLNKFTKAINETDNAAEKSKLSEVMKELVGYLQELIINNKRLTKYEVDRANMMYELTLRQMALEEARDNKTKMRLRRDSQGNYRYEYIADAEKTAEAELALLDQQYKIYELDKKRLLELQEEKEKIMDDYLGKVKEIAADETMTQEEKDIAILQLQKDTTERLEDLYRNYAEDVSNIQESSAGNLDDVLKDIMNETGATAEEMADNFYTLEDGIGDFTDQCIAALDQYTLDVNDALGLLTDGLYDLEATIDTDIEAIFDMLDVDAELIDVWMELVDVCGDLMAQLEELEEHYRGVMLAALDAAEAAAKLKVTDDSTAETRKTEKEKTLTDNAGTVSPKGGSSSSTNKMLEVGLKLAEIMPYMYNIGATDTRPSKEMLLSPIPSGKATKALSNSASAIPAAATIDKARDLEELLKKLKKVSFDTGGYTGEWGTDGRIAMLHLKELVLNSKDTENFLKAADVMRTLQSNIEQILNHANTMSPSFNISVPSSDLNQNVKIEASFPGVTNSREIEDAFNNLVNLASQRAMSTRR